MRKHRTILMAAALVTLVVGCAKNPAGPDPQPTAVATANSGLRLLGRGFPITVTNKNQNTTVAFDFITVDPMKQIVLVAAYAKVSGLEANGYMQLPATYVEDDGSITHIGFAIDEGKVMFHTWNTLGKIPRSFQAWVVASKQ
jgi:hypothetical protein